MDKKSISFNDMPQTLAYLIDKVKRLETLLESRQPAPQVETKEWMSLKEFQEFHPTHPATPTVYSWVRNGIVPYYKKGKQLMFKTTEIVAWLNKGRQQSAEDFENDAVEYLNRRRIER